MVYRKRALKIAVFVLGLAILLLVASLIFVPKNRKDKSKFWKEEAAATGILGERENSIDVLVLGDSESYSSIIPMELWKKTGFSSYVCGTSAQRLKYTKTLLQRAYLNQKPKVVILETNAIFRKGTKTQAAYENICNIFSVFQYHNRWKSFEWKDFSKGPRFTWTDDYKGYIYSNRIRSGSGEEYMEPTDEVAAIPEQNAEYVKEIKQYCEERGARFILWSTPSSKNWNYGRHNAVSELAEKLGCEYVDLNLQNDVVQIDWKEDTRDKGDHVNHSGAVKVTDYLAGYLKGLGILADHSKEKDYRKWNEALVRYELIVEK